MGTVGFISLAIGSGILFRLLCEGIRDLWGAIWSMVRAV